MESSSARRSRVASVPVRILAPRGSWRRCYDGRSMPFIPPMLATRLEDPRRLADPRYIAEPKLDGQRAQVYVREHRTVPAFSRPGRELSAPRACLAARDPLAGRLDHPRRRGGRWRRQRGHPSGVQRPADRGGAMAFTCSISWPSTGRPSWVSLGRRGGNGWRPCLTRRCPASAWCP